MVINVDKGKKIKVSSIDIEGNEEMKDSKLKRAMSNTKVKFPGRFWKGSKFWPGRLARRFRDLQKRLDPGRNGPA